MKEDYAFPIELQPIWAGAAKVPVPKRFAVVRTDTYQALGIVSDKYAPLLHADMVRGFREALEGQNYEESIRLERNGARLYYKVLLPDITVKIKTGDTVTLQMIAENSYDGSRSIRVIFGAFRLICSNGLFIGQKFVTLSRRHMGQDVGMKIDAVRKQIGILTDLFKKTAPVMKEMSETALIPSPIEFFNPKTLQIPKYLTDIAIKSYEDGEDKTTWGAYNAATFAITHYLRKESPSLSISYGRRAYNAALISMK